MFTSGNITVTDDIGTVDACVGVAAELSDDQVSYRIPIVVETIGITAGELVAVLQLYIAWWGYDREWDLAPTRG